MTKETIMTQPTDNEIIETLARFDGRISGPRGGLSPHDEFRDVPHTLPNYLESHDALKGVLAKMSEEQRGKLHDALVRAYGPAGIIKKMTWCWFLLTLDARTLATAIYHAIKDK